MAQDGSEGIWESINYGKFISKFWSNIISYTWGLERIKTKLLRQKKSLLFNQICLNEEMLPKNTHTHTSTHTHAYKCMYLCLYVGFFLTASEKAREKARQKLLKNTASSIEQFLEATSHTTAVVRPPNALPENHSKLDQ